MSEVPALIVWSVFPLGGKVNKGSGQRRSCARFCRRNLIAIMQIDPAHPFPFEEAMKNVLRVKPSAKEAARFNRRKKAKRQKSKTDSGSA